MGDPLRGRSSHGLNLGARMESNSAGKGCKPSLPRFHPVELGEPPVWQRPLDQSALAHTRSLRPLHHHGVRATTTSPTLEPAYIIEQIVRQGELRAVWTTRNNEGGGSFRESTETICGDLSQAAGAMRTSRCCKTHTLGETFAHQLLYGNSLVSRISGLLTIGPGHISDNMEVEATTDDLPPSGHICI